MPACDDRRHNLYDPRFSLDERRTSMFHEPHREDETGRLALLPLVFLSFLMFLARRFFAFFRFVFPWFGGFWFGTPLRVFS